MSDAPGADTPGEAMAATSPYLPHRRILLDADELQALSRIDAGRALRDIGIGWLKILAAFGAVALWPTWWMVALAIPVIGTTRYAHQILAHDGIHRRLHPDSRRNDLLCDLLLLGPVAAVTRVNGQNHLAHHRHLASELDPDRHKYGSYNKRTLPQVLLYVAGLSGLLPQLHNVYRLGKLGDAGEAGTKAPAERYSLRDLAIIFGWQALLIGGLSLAIGWWAYPVLWMLPVFVFMHCADLTRQWLEHAHPIPDAEADARRLLSFESTPIERWLLAPHNMNHHIAHHLWPSIPYYNLPEADRRARERNRSDRLGWRTTYREALGRYLRALPLPAPGSGSPG